MLPKGFNWKDELAGKGSGGIFAGGRYVKDDRSLSISFRHSLGYVTYRIGTVEVGHQDYMKYVAGWLRLSSVKRVVRLCKLAREEDSCPICSVFDIDPRHILVVRTAYIRFPLR